MHKERKRKLRKKDDWPKGKCLQTKSRQLGLIQNLIYSKKCICTIYTTNKWFDGWTVPGNVPAEDLCLLPPPLGQQPSTQHGGAFTGFSLGKGNGGGEYWNKCIFDSYRVPLWRNLLLFRKQSLVSLGAMIPSIDYYV